MAVFRAKNLYACFFFPVWTAFTSGKLFSRFFEGLNQTQPLFLPLKARLSGKGAEKNCKSCKLFASKHVFFVVQDDWPFSTRLPKSYWSTFFVFGVVPSFFWYPPLFWKNPAHWVRKRDFCVFGHFCTLFFALFRKFRVFFSILAQVYRKNRVWSTPTFRKTAKKVIQISRHVCTENGVLDHFWTTFSHDRKPPKTPKTPFFDLFRV